MDRDCTIFLDIDGVINYRTPDNVDDVYQEPTDDWKHYCYLYDRTPELLQNVKMLVTLTNASLVCCSTWRLGRDLAKLNGITFQVCGDIFPHFDAKLRDLLPGEQWDIRDRLILEHVASNAETCQYWLVIDDLSLPGVPEAHHVRPKVGEGFTLNRLAEAWGKLIKQGDE